MVSSEKFERLSTLTQQFNQQCSTLNDTIAEWNTRLANLSLGLEVWLNTQPLETSGLYQAINPETEKPQQHFDRTLLGYAHVDGQWQLAIKEEYTIYQYNEYGQEEAVTDSDQERVIRLLSAGRLLRIKAMERLDGLFELLEAEVTRGVNTVAKAQKLAEIEKP